jgi:hypothetical protein
MTLSLQSFDRWKAAGLHLALSALIALTVVLLLLAVWYPQPYFQAMGGEKLLRLLIGVDVVLGPLITLIIFDPRKPALKWDLAAIAALQVTALAYGGVVMFQARPVYSVFTGDRFEIAAANTVDDASRAKAAPEFQAMPVGGPRLVAARAPADPKELADIAFASAAGGPDLVDLPHLYVPYAQVTADVARASRPLQRLASRGSEEAAAVRAFVESSGRGEATLGYVPVRARNRDFAAVIDRQSGAVAGYIPANPW